VVAQGGPAQYSINMKTTTTARAMKDSTLLSAQAQLKEYLKDTEGFEAEAPEYRSLLDAVETEIQRREI
jgi:hypothetical protein